MAKQDPMFDRIVDAANRYEAKKQAEAQAKAAADRAAQDAAAAQDQTD